MINKILLVISILSFIILLSAIFLPGSLISRTQQEFKQYYDNYLYFNYSNINKLKSGILISSYIILCSLLIFLMNRYKNIYVYAICGLINIFLYILILYLLPQHCALNLCVYKKNKEKPLNNIIGFIGIGDPQIDLRNKLRNIKLNSLVKQINKFYDYIKLNDNSKFIFYENEFRNIPIKLSLDEFNNITNNNIFSFSQFNREETFNKEKIFNYAKDNIVGIFNTGDLTQNNKDGRFFSNSELNLYEYIFNNNPEDNGMLKLSNYECLGNHDYDKWEKFYFDNPSKNVIKRRNKKRKYLVNKDNYSNYSCNFGDLHVVFLNLLPVELKLNNQTYKSNMYNINDDVKNNILDPKKTNSLNFLEADLAKFKNMDTIIITHFLNRFIEKEYERKFNNILKKNKNIKLLLHGHYHSNKLIYYKYLNVLDVYNLISIANTEDDNLNNLFVYFIYYNKKIYPLNVYYLDKKDKFILYSNVAELYFIMNYLYSNKLM